MKEGKRNFREEKYVFLKNPLWASSDFIFRPNHRLVQLVSKKFTSHNAKKLKTNATFAVKSFRETIKFHPCLDKLPTIVWL